MARAAPESAAQQKTVNIPPELPVKEDDWPVEPEATKATTVTGSRAYQTVSIVMGNKASVLKQHGYTQQEEIGQGLFGKTLRVKNDKDGKDYAIKVVSNSWSSRAIFHEDGNKEKRNSTLGNCPIK
ncbi:hypothetical protein GJAV_G00155720 [Gymnothorax javanicus]|nr:hypothetical protein GJAV_G00155720 [Gymnothorax javanicus]